MLNRRLLRIKVMQALYSFFQTEDDNLNIAEKNLLKSLDKMYDLYIYQISALIEITKFAHERLEEAKEKHLPTEEDLNPNTRFVDNRVINALANNKDYILKSSQLKINWRDEQDVFRQIFQEIKESKSYQEYMNAPECTWEDDLKMVINIFKKRLITNEMLQNYFEEKYIFWSDDFYLVALWVAKTVKSIPQDANDLYELPRLYENEDIQEDSEKFVTTLFRQSIIHNKEFEGTIAAKTPNWEIERIALLDIIIIKMALVELMNFPLIPIKVTINEFIEISKDFSSDKSHIFINGLLDKLVVEYKMSGKIVKKGRGLVE